MEGSDLYCTRCAEQICTTEWAPFALVGTDVRYFSRPSCMTRCIVYRKSGPYSACHSAPKMTRPLALAAFPSWATTQEVPNEPLA